MKPSAFQLGRFLILNEADFPPADDHPVSNIRRPSAFFSNIASEFLLLSDSSVRISCDPISLRRLFTLARDTQAGLIYSDYFLRDKNGLHPTPLIGWQEGAIRNDFDFGPFFILSSFAIREALLKYGALPADPDAAWYDLRLKISADHSILHVPECLYTVTKRRQPQKPAGGKDSHFDYVAKENFARQKRYEKIATTHLRRIGACLPPAARKADGGKAVFPVEASIVIPILNRRKTIAGALKSALSQKTDFSFNVIVVDNHSTDGTTGIIGNFAAKHSGIVHLTPKRRDLGIGGCWNEAIQSRDCGRYAVQLDSDDLYSSPAALQKIVDTLRRGRFAMVVGSYTIVNERMKTIPPGKIDHREWTEANGHNNLLRVNGMGAPRAFDTAILRRIGFPNVSYGEDYAVALRITREYRIGRIYESLYWCRRWADNTDASPGPEKQNRHDHYKDTLRSMEIQARRQQNRKSGLQAVPDRSRPGRIFAEYPGKEGPALAKLCRNLQDSQKSSWTRLQDALSSLALVEERKLDCGNYHVRLQFNPARALSSGASVDAESVKKRPCFLCADNLPSAQRGILYHGEYLILCNPAPIFNAHFTVSTLKHQPQKITAQTLDWLLRLSADAAPDFAVFYNGPAAGASAPDHLHFQMIPSGALPFLNFLASLVPAKRDASVRYSQGFDRSIIVLESRNEKALSRQFSRLLKAAKGMLNTPEEPMVNVICVCENHSWRLVVFLRSKHRPDAYFASGKQRLFVSPGAIDMAGVIITPEKRDFERLDCETIRRIYREVSLDEATLDRIVKEL
jgi:glycosyltransferase involved in cell wall biosynthesis